MAVQFRRETAYDFAPYDAREPNGVVVLIPARRFLIAYGRLIAGAIGIDPTVFYQGLPQPVPRATWVDLHPYERGEPPSSTYGQHWLDAGLASASPAPSLPPDESSSTASSNRVNTQLTSARRRSTTS